MSAEIISFPPPKPPAPTAYAVETSGNGAFWSLQLVTEDLEIAKATATQVLADNAFKGVIFARVKVHKEPLYEYAAKVTVEEIAVN